ncbi:hypothetical protein M3649_03150 [Ureibacillus chungkukjangi]|nr:hypothetical protein [Ureibacillus chungkukjangi]MCM3387128.1 hypothetical protein [Ureibacillus chungkukjangi]
MHTFKNIYDKMTYKHKMFIILLLCSFVGSLIFVQNNYSFYKEPIA